MKIILFSIPAHGHVNPSLPVVAELVRRGHHVIFYNAVEFADKIRKTGAEFRPYNIPPEPIDIAEAGNFMFVLWRLTMLCEPIMDAHLAEIIAEKPDILMHDSLASWGKYMGFASKIPTLSLCTTFAFDPEKRYVPSWRLIGNFMFDVFANWSKYQATEDVVYRLAKKHGFKPHVVGELLNNHEKLNIVFTSRTIQPRADKLAPEPKYHFVGSSIQDRNEQIDFQYTSEPLIYVSLGTLMGRDARFFNTAMQAFANAPYQILISIGQFIDEKDLDIAPKNVTIRRYVPQLEVLKKCAVFVTHGGLNSLHEGLYFGVPMLVVPQQAEQAYNGRHIAEKLGAGIVLTKPTAENLLENVRILIENAAFRQNSQQIGASLHEAGGFRAAADRIEAYGYADSARP
jgi:MGT family glycosyltransferase